MMSEAQPTGTFDGIFLIGIVAVLEQALTSDARPIPASWSLRTRRHGVISDFEWTFVHFCSCLPSMQIMTRPLARFAPSA